MPATSSNNERSTLFLAQLYPLMAVGGLHPGSEDSSTLVANSMRTEVQRLLTERQQVTDSDPFAPLNYLPGSSGRRVLFRYRLLEKVKPLIVSKSLPESAPVTGNGKHYSSLLSPGNPQSSLYPDGLLHSGWMYKYRSELPAVFAMFYSLSPSASDDQRLVERIINDRRVGLPAAADVGGIPVKFVVVLLVPPGVGVQEERLTVLRKACALDSRHGLFTLLAGVDIADFVNSFERLMHEYALNFYRECGKRQKKKKSKLSLKPNIAGGLTPAGWAVRYEFKMAVFAEIIQDFDLATKYYITVYNSLIELFAEQAPSGDPSSCSGKSTLKLQPFSRRWQEAVALADSLSYKISKFLLFSESPVNSLLQLNRHINLFYEIRRSIAVQSLNSFEYWGWSAQQYRLFGDVLSMAIGQGVRLPGPDILSAASADMNYLIAKSRISRIFGSSLTMTAAGTAETAVGGSSGKLSPPVGLVALLTPGFYYFMAAQCSANQSSVLKAMEAHSVVDDGGLEAILVREQLQPADRQSAWSECNQRTIDLCTGAYEQFKRHQNHRMALRAAMRIADTYLTVGNAEMAIKFYEKISRSYRKEHQLELLHPVLVKILSCAQKLSDQQTQLRTLADLLSISHYATLISSNAELIEWHAQLRQLINAYQPNTGVSVLRLQTVRPLVSVECRFDQRRAFVDQPVILIVSLQSRIPALTNFHLHGLRVHLAVGQDMLMIRHQPSKISDHQVSKVENRIYSADLTLSADAPLELCVPVQFDCPKEIKIDSLDILLGETVQIPVVASEKSVEKDGTNARLIVEAVRPRFRIECSVETTQVLLDEFLPLDIQLMNDEPFTVRALLDISIRSDLVATQSLDEHQSTPIAAADTLVAIGVPDELSAINRLNLGEIASQSSVHKQLFLRCKKQPGHRTIHITAHFGKVISGSSEPITPSSVSKELKLHAVNPLEHSFEIVRSDRYPSATTQKYHSATQGLAISHQPFLAAPDEPFTHQTDYTVMVSVKNCSPFDLNLLRYGYEPLALGQVENNANCSLIGKNEPLFEPIILPAGISMKFPIQLRVTIDLLQCPESMELGRFYLEWKRSKWTTITKTDDDQHSTKVDFNLPRLILIGPNSRQKSPIAIDFDFPDEINLDAPFTVCYSATNLSHEQQELIATMDVGDGFVFTGYKHLNVLLLPFSTARLEYRLWPLKSGPQFLPHFHLFSKPDTSTGVEPKELPCTSRPIRIFVRPAPMHVGK